MSDDPIQSILAAILLGKSKEEYGELTDEWNTYWDTVELQVKEIKSKGQEVAFPYELE